MPASGSAASNGRTRPSQFTYAPDFSAAAATGNTTFGQFGDGAGPDLQADHETGTGHRGQRGGRIGQVGDLHPADQQAGQPGAVSSSTSPWKLLASKPRATPNR